MEAPTILRVKDPDEEDKPRKIIHPHLPQIYGFGQGALILMISPVRTGKSTIISNMLLNNNLYGEDAFDSVKIISNTIDNCITSRFLKEAFDVSSYYDDSLIEGIIKSQKSFEKSEQPEIAIIIDDCLGSLKRESAINHLSSRYRHFNIKMLLFSSQKFTGSVSPVIRANCTNLIIGSPFSNQKELGKIFEEYGDSFGGVDNLAKIYKLATPNRFDFLHISLQDNPPKCYRNFETLLSIGPDIIGQAKFKKEDDEEDKETKEVNKNFIYNDETEEPPKKK
tara:strand:+ start:3121 stop:3960 length:840 start_codon:yes stop_codon:yes gene_type:complete